jgi:hypothetical protein
MYRLVNVSVNPGTDLHARTDPERDTPKAEGQSPHPESHARSIGARLESAPDRAPHPLSQCDVSGGEAAVDANVAPFTYDDSSLARNRPRSRSP